MPMSAGVCVFWSLDVNTHALPAVRCQQTIHEPDSTAFFNLDFQLAFLACAVDLIEPVIAVL